jgi:hypothetical protein
MTQVYPIANIAGTVGDALNAARSGAFGKRYFLDTNIHYYSPDESQIIKTMEVNSKFAPTIRSEVNNLSTVIPTNGLIVYLDSANSTSYIGSGTTWYDISGNNNNATIQNGTTWVNSNLRSYMSFDGVDDFLSFSYNNASFTDSITIIGWLSLIGNSEGFFDIGRTDNYYPFSNNGQLYIGTASDTRQLNNYVNPFNKYTNHQVALTSGPGTNNYIIYQNDTLTGFWTRNSFNVSNSKGFSIDRKFRGKLFNVLIYNRVLSQTEVTAVYNAFKSRYITSAPAGVDTNGLIMYLDASDSVSYPGTGATWYDITGNENHMTLINGPVYVSDGQASYFSFDATNDNASFVLNNTLSSTATLIIWLRKNTIVNNTTSITLGNRGDDWHTYGGQGYYSIFRSARITTGQGIAGQGVNLNSSILQDHMRAFSSSIGTNGYNVYQNGFLVASDTGLSIVTTNKNILSPFDGRIYAMSIYNRALSQQEILAIYNSQKSRYGL